MAFKDKWRPRVDGVDDCDASAVNEIAEAVIANERGIGNKVDKEEGKGLSSNDYTDSDKAKVDATFKELGNVHTRMENKVDKVDGKGLSTNDYTNDDKKTVSSCVLRGTESGEVVLIDDAIDGKLSGELSAPNNPAQKLSDVGVYVGGLNLYNHADKEVNKNFNSSGVIVDVSTLYGNMASPANVSGYIPVIPLSTMTISHCNSWIFYDENANVVEFNNKSATIKRTITVPESATFMRFSYHTVDSGVSSAIYDDGTNVMAVLGSALPNSYIPFTGALSKCDLWEHWFTVQTTPPYISIATDTVGVVVTVEYVKDISKVIENVTRAIISLGGNV